MSISNPLLTTGRTLTFAAWLFGAIGLGVGNAHFGVGLGGGHAEHQVVAVGGADATEHCHNALSSAISETLLAHCLFCLDGLAATEPAEPRPLIRFSNALVPATGPQKQNHPGLTDPSIAQPRGPPTTSPS